MKNSRQFYCEYCGGEVGVDDKKCPFCGRFFTSVRCPVCSYQSTERRFEGGCPKCGYLASPDDIFPEKERSKQKEKLFLSKSFYLIMGGILTGLLILLVFLYIRLL
jgi:uncharacterized membrane protein YvbJ